MKTWILGWGILGSAIALITGCTVQPVQETVPAQKTVQEVGVKTPVTQANNGQPEPTPDAAGGYLGDTTAPVSTICPIPPKGYERIPGYEPGRVDPARTTKPLEILSPIAEETKATFYESMLSSIHFCGTAEADIVKVKLFSSGRYLYEQVYPEPATPSRLMGEIAVKDGLWFISFDFRDGPGRRTIRAIGYDQNDEPVESQTITIFLADVNPG